MSGPRELIDRTLVFWQAHEGDAPDLARTWIDALKRARNSGDSVDKLLGIVGHARRKQLVANRRTLIAYLYETRYAGQSSLYDASQDIEDDLALARRNPYDKNIGARFKIAAAVMRKQGIRHPSWRTVYEDLRAIYNE